MSELLAAEEYIVAPFCLYEQEANALRELGGMLTDHVEAAIKLYLRSDHQRFGTDLLCNGPRQTFHVRVEKSLYDRIMDSWSHDPLGEAVQLYINHKRKVAA
jgi:hypothetical protein